MRARVEGRISWNIPPPYSALEGGMEEFIATTASCGGREGEAFQFRFPSRSRLRNGLAAALFRRLVEKRLRRGQRGRDII